MSLQNIYPSLQGGFGLLHRGEGLVQLPGGGGHLEPGHPGHPAPAPSQTCAGVRLREGDLSTIPTSNIIIYRDAYVSKKDKSPKL